ncbi:MAG: sulfurtransferase [Phenylobacterium sp.]|uniref:sulfurtransferase n=1 Tax=Phenylobacterium sp. TaxID=1871053 RepID=UPI0025E41EED|nr:sulfurtransferase [Phenylobacterium sp.]MBI1200012.1 sulfurtransferase [Phenylobacterium sp.]
MHALRTLVLALVAAFGLLAHGALAAARQPLVDAAWLQAHASDAGVVVIDVRPAEAYAAGHVKGALSAPYASFGWRGTVDGVPEQLPPPAQIQGLIRGLGVNGASHVVIVTAGANATDFGAATRVYWTFRVLGHDEVSVLDGGQRAWTGAGLPLDTATPPPPAAGDFTARLNPALLADTAEVEAAMKAGVRLIDARPPDQFSGAKKSPIARVGGAIPGAVDAPLTEFYDAEAGRFADKAAVEAAAKAHGVDPDKPAIAYCNSGHMSSVDWFGLSEVLGQKDVKLYDGSMAAWTADPARPVSATAEPAH